MRFACSLAGLIAWMDWVTFMKNKSIVLALVVAAIFGISFPVLAESFSAGSKATSRFLDDTALTIKVIAAYVSDKNISIFDVSVRTENGVVVLAGKNSESERLHAQDVALAVTGVRDVKNNIQLLP